MTEENARCLGSNRSSCLASLLRAASVLQVFGGAVAFITTVPTDTTPVQLWMDGCVFQACFAVAKYFYGQHPDI